MTKYNSFLLSSVFDEDINIASYTSSPAENLNLSP